LGLLVLVELLWVLEAEVRLLVHQVVQELLALVVRAVAVALLL
jgi:hypothetical protein